MKYDQLIQTCINCMLEFDPVKMTVDSHSEQFTNKHKRNLEDTEAVFVKQVFYGTFRYEEFLKVLSDSIFRHLPSQTNRNDWPLYHVFGYLICFRIDELPFHEFKRMVQSQDAVKMNVFFTFLFDIDLLLEIVKPGWIDIYDEGYIDNDIIGKLEERLPQVAELLAQLSEKATGKKSDLVNTLESTLDIKKTETKNKVQKRASTVPQPFQLTKPKPKKLPEPIKIPKQVERKEIPKNLNKNTLQTIQNERNKKKEEARQKINDQYNEDQQFKFKTHQRPSNKQKITNEVKTQFEKDHKYVKSYYRPAPDFSEPSDVKLNAAAILREEKKLLEKEEQEKKRLHDLEWNLRDSTEFENWKIEQKHKDRMDELEEQQRKKIEMALAREAAMIAYEQKIEENKQTVTEMKQISKDKALELKEIKQEELQKKQELIEGVLETRDNANKEKQKLIQKNKQIHDQKIEDMEKIMALKKQEEEEERKKRDELIKQIRELERQPKKRTCGYDPTETMGYGLLEEMSMVELREKLEHVKMEQKLREEEVRQQNLQKKDKYLNSMQKKVEMIKQNRQQLSQQKQLERQERKRKEQEEKLRLQQIKEKQLLEVHSKIKDKKLKKKMEEDQLAKDLREIKLKRQYMNASAALVEEMAWKALQDGAEREIQQRQVEKLMDQERIESIKFKERKILAETAKRNVQEKMDFNTQYDINLDRKQREQEILYEQLQEDQRKVVNTIKEYEKKHAENMLQRDTFKYKISEMSLTNAKTSQKKKLENSKRQQLQSQQQQQQSNYQDMELPGQKYLPQVQEEENQQQQQEMQA